MQSQDTRNRILFEAMNLIRQRGYTATRVDDVCTAAGVTKGGFFHYFKSKEEMATAAAQFFADFADQLFANAPFQAIEDPVDRLLGYIDFRESLLQGDAPAYTCLLGTMVQEVHQTSPAIRDACHEHIWGHAETLVPTIQAAIDQRRVKGVDARDLALFTQATLQGAFILAKAGQSPEPAKAAVKHLRDYITQIL